MIETLCNLMFSKKPSGINHVQLWVVLFVSRPVIWAAGLGEWRGVWARGWLWILLRDGIFGGLRQRLSFMRRWSRGRRCRSPPKFTFYICSHLWFSPCLARAEVKVVPQPGRSLSARRLLFFLPCSEVPGFTASRESGDETEHYREDVTADVFTEMLLPRCS